MKEGLSDLGGSGISSGRLRGRTDAPQGAQKLLRVSTRRSGDFLGDLPRLNKLGDGGDKVSRAPQGPRVRSHPQDPATFRRQCNSASRRYSKNIRPLESFPPAMPKQTLAEDADQLIGHCPAHGVAGRGRKKQLKAFNSIGAIRGMQGSQNKVTGFACLYRGNRRLHVPNFPHEDGIRILAQGTPQSFTKARRVDTYLSLGEERHAVCEEIFDRILNRYHMAGKIPVHPFQSGGNGRVFPEPVGPHTMIKPDGWRSIREASPQEGREAPGRGCYCEFAEEPPRAARVVEAGSPESGHPRPTSGSCRSPWSPRPLRTPSKENQKRLHRGREFKGHQTSSDPHLRRAAFVEEQIGSAILLGRRAEGFHAFGKGFRH